MAYPHFVPSVDPDGNALKIPIMFFRGQLESGLDAFENNVLGDVLFPVHQVHDPQHVGAIHNRSSEVRSP